MKILYSKTRKINHLFVKRFFFDYVRIFKGKVLICCIKSNLNKFLPFLKQKKRKSWAAKNSHVKMFKMRVLTY